MSLGVILFILFVSIVVSKVVPENKKNKNTDILKINPCHQK
jgi:flagellar biogenesis protein FliO